MTSRIVVLEDEPADQRFFERAVLRTALPVSVTMCPDLSQAREEIDIIDPDLVIVDLNVPGGRGIDLIGQLHRDRPLLPTVVLTSSTAPWDHRDAIEAGARAVHTKPFDWVDYRDLIDRLLRYWLI